MNIPLVQHNYRKVFLKLQFFQVLHQMKCHDCWVEISAQGHLGSSATLTIICYLVCIHHGNTSLPHYYTIRISPIRSLEEN